MAENKKGVTRRRFLRGGVLGACVAGVVAFFAAIISIARYDTTGKKGSGGVSRDRAVAVAALIITTLLWALPAIAIRYLSDYFDGFTQNLYRYGISAVLVLGVSLVRRRWRVDPTESPSLDGRLYARAIC